MNTFSDNDNAHFQFHYFTDIKLTDMTDEYNINMLLFALVFFNRWRFFLHHFCFLFTIFQVISFLLHNFKIFIEKTSAGKMIQKIALFFTNLIFWCSCHFVFPAVKCLALCKSEWQRKLLICD